MREKALPPGPREPAALQTVEWIVRPTALLRRAQARYGEPFTLRTAWTDAPLVLTSDPQEIKRIYAAPPDVLQARRQLGDPRAVRGPQRVLILNGDEHLGQRRLMLPPFHGEALKRRARRSPRSPTPSSTRGRPASHSRAFRGCSGSRSR